MRHFDTMQKDELSQLITEYSDLFPDVPTKTTAVYHDIIIIINNNICLKSNIQTSSVDCAPRELTHACSRSRHVFTQ